jgi:hypothetical protein
MSVSIAGTLFSVTFLVLPLLALACLLQLVYADHAEPKISDSS